MPGQRAKESATYLTRRTTYRENVNAVDGGGPQDTGIPTLNTLNSPGDSNQYGHDARLMVSALIYGFSSVTFQVWLYAEEELINGETASANADLLPTTDLWVLVNTTTLTASGLFVVKDVPPGKYKVIVSAKTGNGNVRLRTQYAA